MQAYQKAVHLTTQDHKQDAPDKVLDQTKQKCSAQHSFPAVALLNYSSSMCSGRYSK